MVISTTTKYSGYYNSTYEIDEPVNPEVLDVLNNIAIVKGYPAEVGDCLLAYSTTNNKSYVYRVTTISTPGTISNITPTITNSGTDIFFRFYAIRDDSPSGGNNIYEANGAGDDDITLVGTFKSDGYFTGHIVTSLPADTTDYQDGDIISINNATYNGSLLICNKGSDIWEQLVIALKDCSFHDQASNVDKYIGNIGTLNEFFYALSDYTGYYYTDIVLANLNTTITLFKDGTYVLVFNSSGPDEGANLFIAESGSYTNITGDTYYKYIFRDKRSSNLYLIDTDEDTSTIIISGEKVDAAVTRGYVNLDYSDNSVSSNLFKSTSQVFVQNLPSSASGNTLFQKQPPSNAKVIIGDYATSPTLQVTYATVSSVTAWRFNASAISEDSNKTVIFEYSENGLNITLIYLLIRTTSIVSETIKFYGDLDLSELEGGQIEDDYALTYETDGITVLDGLSGIFTVPTTGMYQITALINYNYPSLVNNSVKDPDADPVVYYNTNFQIYNDTNNKVLSTSKIPQTRFNGMTNGSSSGFVSQGQVYIIAISQLTANDEIYLRYMPDELGTTITFDDTFQSMLNITKL